MICGSLGGHTLWYQYINIAVRLAKLALAGHSREIQLIHNQTWNDVIHHIPTYFIAAYIIFKNFFEYYIFKLWTDFINLYP